MLPWNMDNASNQLTNLAPKMKSFAVMRSSNVAGETWWNSGIQGRMSDEGQVNGEIKLWWSL